jgi:hypothetical protein
MQVAVLERVVLVAQATVLPVQAVAAHQAITGPSTLAAAVAVKVV